MKTEYFTILVYEDKKGETVFFNASKYIKLADAKRKFAHKGYVLQEYEMTIFYPNGEEETKTWERTPPKTRDELLASLGL